MQVNGGVKMGILTKSQINQRLYNYYKANYGESGGDIWYEPPALNVWVFARQERLVTLRCHIIKGTVEKFEELL